LLVYINLVMGVPILGVNIPAPKVKIKPSLLEKYANLYRGIHDRGDTVSWRTLIITVRELLGEESPDFKKVDRRLYSKGRKLIKLLVSKTYFEPLIPEIEYAVGIRNPVRDSDKDLDLLLLSGRHFPEPIIWTLADFAKTRGKNVAVINPVGHYNDGQTRVVGPTKYFRKIKKLVILASTQSKCGGSISVLANVVRLLRNAELTKKVESVEVVIPMFGGSRGHKYNQGPEVGYEIREASFNAKILSLVAKDIVRHLIIKIPKVPEVRFSSIDIHSDDYPARTFNEAGFKFVSINPSKNLAKGIISLLNLKKIKVPLKLVACDKGAVSRTENLAKELILGDRHFLKGLQVIYIEKKRLSAGVVASAEIAGVEEWKREGCGIHVKKLKVPQKPIFKSCVIVYSDDMIDTGGTAERDLKFISGYYPNTSLKIFAASHPVFSKGFGAVKRIGADAYILGNTLSWEGLSDIKGVEVVDFAEAIYKFIFTQNS
jgi:phosphoribosylpyrophosphate synthetase